MKLKTRIDYSEGRRRAELAKFLSNTIEGKDEKELPYKPNEYCDYFWTLDMMNNWKVEFYEEEPFVFSIIYRYQCAENQYEEALAGWLKIKMGVEIV